MAPLPLTATLNLNYCCNFLFFQIIIQSESNSLSKKMYLILVPDKIKFQN